MPRSSVVLHSTTYAIAYTSQSVINHHQFNTQKCSNKTASSIAKEKIRSDHPHFTRCSIRRSACSADPHFTGSLKSRLTEHLASNNLFNPHQSAYIKHHSTETALLYIHDHLINAIGSQKVSCLCLLDLSASFDTTDH